MNSSENISRQPSNKIDLKKIVPSIAASIAVLDSGLLAALRRGPLEDGGSVAFWQLMAKYQIPEYQERRWAVLIQAIAILTPKGERSLDRSPHNPKKGLGVALYNANFSELRLARLLSARQDMRLDLTVRACRRLAACNCNEFDIITLAKLILFDDDYNEHKIAREYFRTESQQESNKENNNPTQN